MTSHQPVENHIEAIAQEAYDRCHPDDTFEALKHRATFSKEDSGLLGQWLAFARDKAGTVAAIRTGGFGPQPQ